MQALPVAGKPPDNVVFVAEVPKDRLAGIEGPRVEVASLVFNALDEIVDSRRTEMALEANRIEQSSAFLLTALSARPGTYKSRVVLRNIETGRAAVAGASVVVPEAAAAKIIVFPPLLVSEEAGSVLLDTATDKPDGRSTGAARAAQAFLFDPKRYMPYLGDQLTAGAAITAAVRCTVTGNDGSGLELSAKLISQASGEEHAIALTILEKREDKEAKVFLARLEIPEVAAGLYRMAFIVSDGRSGLSSRIIRNFVIE